jgi:hypothetical protein
MWTNWRVIQIGRIINKNITGSSLEKVNDKDDPIRIGADV